MHSARAGEDSGGHQQGVARQEETDEHSGFDENNDAHHQRPAPSKQAADVVKARQNVLQELNHSGHFWDAIASTSSHKSSKYNNRKARGRESPRLVLSSYNP